MSTFVRKCIQKLGRFSVYRQYGLELNMPKFGVFDSVTKKEYVKFKTIEAALKWIKKQGGLK